MIRTTFPLALFILLNGCASSNIKFYSPPVEIAGQKTPASIIGVYDTKEHIMICHLKASYIIAADGQPIKYSMTKSQYDQPVKFSAGWHTLLIQDDYSNGCMGDDTYKGFALLAAKLPDTGNYRLGLTVDPQQVSNWVEDMNGNPISNKVIFPMKKIVINVVMI